MNRIEQIKNEYYYTLDGYEYHHATDDVQYLLSKLEQAEKALETIANIEMGATSYPHVQIALEALKAIRE